MRLKQRILRNSSLEMATKVSGILAGIFLSPFLIRHLTKETYGLWVLIGSVVGYFGFTDFGVRSATVRLIAFYRARENHATVNRTLNTSLMLLAASGLVVTLFTAALAPVFAGLFHVDAGVPHVASSVFACGLAVAIGLPLTVFEGCLAGHERYDLINACEILAIIGRVALTVWLLRAGYGIFALAAINLGLTVANGTMKWALSKWVFPSLHVSLRNFDRSLAKETYTTSVWFFVLAISGRISFFTDNVVIGYFLGTGAVAVYSIGGRLMQYALVAVSACNVVLMPVATRFEAQANLTGQRRLLLLGTRASLAAAIFMATMFLTYGGQIIRVWVGPGFEQAAVVLAILTLPMITASSQMTTLIVVQGMAKHKTLSFIYLGEAVSNLVLSIILVKPMGIVGVALGTALTSTFSSLIAQPIYVCRVLSLGVWDYYRKAFLPVLLAAAPLVALLVCVRHVWLPQRLVTMAIFCAMAASVYFGTIYLIFFTKRGSNRGGFA
jgi:O-antigen/teichoic acid export membrane protein